MKISIITVCKNAEKAIERTLLSVLSQSCYETSVEYWVIDGASTDKTVEIIKKYGERRRINWISEADGGIYDAMNKGIGLSKGKWLLFLNAGDYLAHYNVLKLLTNLFESDKYDIIHGNIFAIETSSGEHSIIKGSRKPDLAFFYQNSMPHQAIFYKRELFEKYGLYEEKFKFVSDSILNKKLFCDKSVKTKYVDNVISVYFIDGISSVPTLLKKQENEMFRQNYFSENERGKALRQMKKRKRSLLRFLAKKLMQIHDFFNK